MQQFIGTKLVESEAMNRLDYNKYRGWELPEDENGDDEGYLIEYLDGGESNHPNHKGYISWSPKEQFDNAYRPTDGMSFGLAVEAMKKGLKCSRSGWNGANMFAYIVPANSYPAQTDAIKTVFPDDVPYREYFALKTAQDDVATWHPSGSDALADDWMIVE